MSSTLQRNPSTVAAPEGGYSHGLEVVLNGEVRRRWLGEARPALTVVIVQTIDSRWLLEIEAVAAATRGPDMPSGAIRSGA